jgi:quercetin dioxygenase-like cupin family protein
MFDLHGEAQSGPPPHTHPWDEAYYVLEGQVLVVVGDDERVLEPGDVANVPGGEQHLYRILSPRARFLVITSPEGAAAFFRDMDANVGPLPDSLATLVAVAKRNKLTSPLFPD